MKESPSDEELRTLIRGAKATIYVPVDEDFGMSPVESMACGTPVIGVDDGGLKESIIRWKNWYPHQCQNALQKISVKQ
jgi:glycosyltransferase involved in cell wall biosynthesis